MKACWSLTLTVLVVAGCMSSPPRVVDEPTLSSDETQVFVYRREGDGGGLYDIGIYLNGIRVARLREDNYTTFRLPASTYVIGAIWEARELRNQGGPMVAFPLGGGQSHYISVGVDGSLYGARLGIRPVEPGAGRAEIAGMRLRPVDAATIEQAVIANPADREIHPDERRQRIRQQIKN